MKAPMNEKPIIFEMTHSHNSNLKVLIFYFSNNKNYNMNEDDMAN